MVPTAIIRKSITDLTRRKARTALTVATLAIAVASVGIFGIGALMQRAMAGEIDGARLADLTVTTGPLPVDASHLRAIERLPNVEAVQPKTVFSTRILVGDRRQRALVIAVPDLTSQRVDKIHVKGAAAGLGGFLTERQNAVMEKFGGGTGSAVRVLGADGRPHRLVVSGEGHFVGGGNLVADGGFAVFYAAPGTLTTLGAPAGTTMLAMRLRDTSRAAAQRTADEVRGVLEGVPGFQGFADLPEIRTPGEYPGKTLFGQVTTIMTLITVLALLSALVLVANTMSTLIGEQTAEIGAMKAIGASRRQISLIYTRTALLLGLGGAMLGAALGVVLSNAVVSYFGSRFYGIDVGVHVAPAVLGASVVVGLIGPPLAAIPAIRRAGNIPIVEAFGAGAAGVGPPGRLDAALRRLTWLPRTVQVGIRGAGRRKRRTLATVVQVALAVGTLLALLSLGAAVGQMTHGFYDASRWDIWVQTAASKPLDPGSDRIIRAIPGVTGAEPLLANSARAGGTTVQMYGLVDRPLYQPELSAGRWYSPAEASALAPVAVIGRALSERAGVPVGGRLQIRTASGPAVVRVIGTSTNVLFQGAVVFMPLRTMQRTLGTPEAVNNYWVTTGGDRATTDRVTNQLEDTLGRRGNQLTTIEKYVQERDNTAANAGLTNSISVLGLLIVAISLVGLVNAITMGVIERTREIGMLRCVGARARDVRRIFASEGLLVAGLGWSVGVPLGLALAYGLRSMTASIADTDLGFVFPLVNVAGVLVGTLVLAAAVLILPVRRAVRLRPGDALRRL